MSNIFVRIIGEFKDAGFKKAQKSTYGLTKSFDNLRRSARRTFVTIAGVAALKRSVQAFAAEDAAIQKLAKSLDNLGLRFESGGVDQYLESLEKATTVTKEQLYPAFQQLANTTLSVSKSQQLLNAALDISAGTGKDLTAVVTALSRAFNGNFASLGKLQTSYTTAELEAMGFNNAVTALNEQFSGSAATAANTYEGKIKRMNIAFGDAAEAIGEGVVDALEALGGGNYDKGLEKIVAAGEGIANAFRSASKFLMVTKFALTGGLFKSRKEIEAFSLAVNSAFAPPDAAKQRTFMRERSKYLQSERKQTEKIRKEREKAAKLLEQEKKNQKIIAEAQKTFDMERIQIEAALKGKINDVEEYRLKLQRAILNENVDNVIKYTGLLKEAETQADELAQLLAKLPEMAENPFTDWPSVIARVQYLLKELDWQIPIDVLFAEKGLRLDQDKMTVTKLDTMNVSAGNVYVSGNIFGQTSPSGAPLGNGGTGIPGNTGNNNIANPIVENIAASNENTSATKKLTEQIETLTNLRGTTETGTGINFLLKEHIDTLATGLIASGAMKTIVDEATQRAAMAEMAIAAAYQNFDIGSFRMKDEAPSVVVNVAGSVIAEQDLVQSITNSLYNIQSNGQVLLHKRTIL